MYSCKTNKQIDADESITSLLDVTKLSCKQTEVLHNLISQSNKGLTRNNWTWTLYLCKEHICLLYILHDTTLHAVTVKRELFVKKK